MAINFTRRVISSGHASVDDLNTNFSNLESAVSRGLSRYSDTPNAMQSTLDMNSNRLINLPNAISSTEPVTYGQWVASATATTLQGMPNQVLTATAGQTVFNFTGISWGGADTVKVYVNGVRQFTGYSLTDSNTITFSYGLQVGDEVMAETLNFSSSATTTTSNLVTHTPAGTGAVNRTVQSILRRWITVQDFGAVGDGTTDDTSAFQAALNYAGTIRGTVYVPATTNGYVVSSLTMYSSTGLVGDGMHQTLIYRKPGSTGTFLREKTVGEGNSGGATGIQIKDLLIDGQSTTGDGINLGNQGGAQLNFCSSLQNVHVREFVGTGFDLNNNATACHYLWSNLNTVGFKIRGGSSNYHDMWAEANSSYGIEVLSSDNRFFGCYFEGDATVGTDTAFIRMGSGSQNVFYGVHFSQLNRNFTKLIWLDSGVARNDFHHVQVSAGIYTVANIIYSQAYSWGRGSETQPIIKFWVDHDTNAVASPESYYFSTVTGRLGIVRGAGDRLSRVIASVASAANITLVEGNLVNITGTTGITDIVATNQTGRLVVLKFSGVLTVTDGGNLRLNGNFTTSSDDTLTLTCDGTNWYEVARSAN